MSNKIVIQVPGTPAPTAPFSQAIRVDDTIYLSGCLGVDPQTGNLVSEEFGKQVRQALKNIQAVLESAGSSLENVIKTTCFLSDINNMPEFNKIYQESFKENFPARSTFQVAKLPRNGLVEIEAIALVNQNQKIQSNL